MLIKYYEGQLMDADADLVDEGMQFKPPTKKINDEETKSAGLTEEKIKPKKGVKPILQKLSERRPTPEHYLGTSFGVTKELF